MKENFEPPQGIVLTISEKMYGEHGYKHWLKNFLAALNDEQESIVYNFRVPSQPTKDREVRYVYLIIGGKIRFRCYYGGSRPGQTLTLGNGEHTKDVRGKAWIICAGPTQKPPVKIEWKGFRGYRYCDQLW